MAGKSDGKLGGRLALVTGSGIRIGRAAAVEQAREGSRRGGQPGGDRYLIDGGLTLNLGQGA